MHSLVYIEPSEEKLDPLVLQIAAKLRELPEELRGPVRGIALGDHLKGKQEALSPFLDELLGAEVAPGEEYSTEVAGRVLAEGAKELGPGLVFLGFTHQGMELAPTLGAILGIPVLTGCVDFRLGPGVSTGKRLLHSGKVAATYEVPTDRGVVFSVPKGALRGVDTEATAAGQLPVRTLPRRESWQAEKTRVLEILKEPASEGEDVTRARILVSVGRGLGSPDGLPAVRELAGLVDGVVSCSRPVVDLGWLPASHQVGLSGKSVSPVVYLALGISGQGNHVAGMEASRIIIAVNKDARAPIFQVAHYGVVDDLHQFIPQLIEQARKEGG